MKNIHVLPTDKASRLHTYKGVLNLAANEFVAPTIVKNDLINLNIYITSDEEIKEGYVNHIEYGICKVLSIKTAFIECETSSGIKMLFPLHCKKIIATTDQDLIKDGVQSIDDAFLEWFVKNPSCEMVEVNDSKVVKEHIFDGSNDGEIIWEKKIRIPQEESKYIEDKFEFESRIINEVWDRDEEPKQEKLTYTEAVKKEERIFNSIMMKQETLEEVAEREYPKEGKDSIYCDLGLIQQDAFKFGAKWQQEQYRNKYSDKEVKHIIREALQSALVTVDLEQWFKQFKKK